MVDGMALWLSIKHTIIRVIEILWVLLFVVLALSDHLKHYSADVRLEKEKKKPHLWTRSCICKERSDMEFPSLLRLYYFNNRSMGNLRSFFPRLSLILCCNLHSHGVKSYLLYFKELIRSTSWVPVTGNMNLCSMYMP